MHEVQILKDSISNRGHRLTTFEVKLPRIVLAELNTHCMFGRNSASSRAIPVQKMLRMVMEDPYIPSEWGKNQKGMQAEEEVIAAIAAESELEWLRARDSAVRHAQSLLELGIHKQLTNRLLEPFMWHTVIITATDYWNFFHLRNDKHAHPDIRIPAAMMQRMYEECEPDEVDEGGWHLPLVQDSESQIDLESLIQISTGRCTRISYLTHDGVRDVSADVELHDKILGNGHMSPLEHEARAMDDDEYENLFCQDKMHWVGTPTSGEWVLTEDDDGAPMKTHYCAKLNGWVQYRKLIKGEEDYALVLRERAG